MIRSMAFKACSAPPASTPDQGSMADAGMHEAMRDAEARGADAVVLAAAYAPARFDQRAGASGSIAGVAMDLRLGWGSRLTRSKPRRN